MSVGKLPEGWVGSKLGDVVDVNSGIGFPIKYQGKSSGDYPVYKVRDISSAVARNNGNLNIAGHYVSAKEAVELRGKIFRSGTTVFAKIGEAVRLNRRAIIQTSGLADNNVMAISAILHEMDKFIFHFMNTIDLSEQARSTTVPSIRKGDVENILLSLPPLAEQKIITEKLDTLLAQVDSTKARLEQIPQILKRFRQAVYQYACSGRILDKVNPKITQLETLVSIHNGARKPVSSVVREGIKGIYPYYGATGIVDYLNDFTHEGRFLLVGEDGANLLSKSKKLAYIINGKSWVNNHAHVLKEKDNNLLDFIQLAINSLDISQWVSGSAQPKLTKKSLLTLPIPVFTLEEQTIIVRRVEQLFAYADTIEKQVNNALARVNNLTQSILAKAFRGELTAQWRAENPELISGENSAAALLEKIKAERAASGGKKASRKKS
ncbi:TPA: restriction endonuclease subunit S [Escherichia coli]|uniref:restriction endonuclease subunit S n=2 Tax=Escherichia coli TaxID=562 RepID=UPI00191C7F08|nr:restriction endonuclease subunit S [Escherichia coli]EII6222729.1 restriction endonuclease subunit S [Escherichia coli]ELQ1256242.1 restriction endonuclease subunit S [Escherichia coli]ELS9774669.1 restriction endonuclease subunit S [Escherichia coli]MBM3051168.1 restriction endonuclease subunit S [Escherichia coli]MCS1113777.1 restriction endonuclease subunit S [Escherichia coli]